MLASTPVTPVIPYTVATLLGIETDMIILYFQIFLKEKNAE